MPEPNANGARTHEPSLRELTGDLDGLREFLLSKLDAIKEILNERDKLYKERDDSRRTAVDAALAAAKEQTKASFDASEKAIVKAEEAQKSYNQTHNDLSRKLDEQNKNTIPRPEAESRFNSLEEKIGALQRGMIEMTGVHRGGEIAWGYVIASIMVILSVATTAIALLRSGAK